MRKLFYVFFISFLSLAITSCDEDSTVTGGPSDEDMQPVANNMGTEKGVMNAVSYMNPYGLDEDLSGKSVTDGPVMIWINLNDYIVEIDFANVNGSGGKITVDYDSNPFAANLDAINAIATLENYVSDGITYNGELNFSMVSGLTTPVFTITNVGLDAALTAAQGENISTWLGTKALTWLDGRDTPFSRIDDAFEISGSSSGVTILGDSYTASTTALYMAPDCEYIMSGAMVFVNNVGANNQTTLTMDFGVDSGGNALNEPACNPYFKLNYVTSILNLNIVMSMDDL